MTYYPARAVVDLGAIRSNVEMLSARTDAEVMAVVKAEGYGHGMVPAAEAAVAGGATWLGAAHLDDALRLRDAGFELPILTWVYAPGAPLEQVLIRDIDVSVPAVWALNEVVAAAEATRTVARIHVKVDTGMGRNGAAATDLPELFEAVAEVQGRGRVEVVGLWSHMACADSPGSRENARQIANFKAASDLAAEYGIDPEVRHLANSAAALLLDDAHFDLVRPGLAIYGLNPAPNVASNAEFGLQPAMRLEANISLVKDVPAGQGVSYDLTYRTEDESRLAVIPLGYGDGIPRHISNRGQVLAGTELAPIAGRICMDQFVVDVGRDNAARAGDVAVLFGSGEGGEPTAQEWAQATGTISYEIVTRISPRIPRVYLPF